MKKGDLIWGGILVFFIAFLIFPPTHEIFISATKGHPFLVGFIKFFILASMGELLARRLGAGKWIKPSGLILRGIIWGFLGMVFVVIFPIYATGIQAAMKSGILPGNGSNLAFAFFTSAIMNISFAPTMMLFHRITDTWIDLKIGEGRYNVGLNDIVDVIDFKGLINFVYLKTIPIFWIPAHTITFLLPAEYRVMMAAMLSIALGAILAFAKRKKA
jgi:hypothetical protein